MSKRIHLSMTFSPDADGLYKLVARLLTRQHKRKITIRDSDLVARLGVTPAELASMQATLNSEDMMSCNTGPTRTTYRFAPDANTCTTEAGHA